MDFETIRTTTLDFVREHQAWAPVITGIIAFCESLAVLSFLVPATVILLGSARCSAPPTSRSCR